MKESFHCLTSLSALMSFQVMKWWKGFPVLRDQVMKVLRWVEMPSAVICPADSPASGLIQLGFFK